MDWGCVCGLFLAVSVVFALVAAYQAFYREATGNPEAAQQARQRGGLAGMFHGQGEQH
jgi:hypothetical protein